MFLARNADRVFGTNYFQSQAIPSLLEEETGWSRYVSWHSIYPWLASDFGWVGAVIMLGIISFLLGLSWRLALNDAGPEWVALASLLLLLFAYVPANNQMLQSGENVSALFLTVLLAIFRIRKLPTYRQ